MSHHGQAWKQRAQDEFERWAETYDRSVLNRLLFRRCYLKFMEFVLPHCREANGGVLVLDVGTGTGTFPAMLAETTLPVRSVGLDMALGMCQAASRKIKHVGLSDAAAFVAGDSEHLPFRENTFDVITCANSFHHYPHKERALADMHRTLREGGHLIILDGFRDNVIGWFIFDVCVASAEKAVHHCPAPEMRALFDQAGFADVVQEKFGFWAPVLATIGRKGGSLAASCASQRPEKVSGDGDNA